MYKMSRLQMTFENKTSTMCTYSTLNNGYIKFLKPEIMIQENNGKNIFIWKTNLVVSLLRHIGERLCCQTGGALPS